MVEQARTRVGGRPPRVLVVDDNAANRIVSERMLRLIGCDVVLAEDGAVAVRLAGEQDFDAILMDCQMPVLDGFAAARAIRAHEVGGRVPIIAMSASVTVAEREAATAAGMDDFLPKPVPLHELWVAVQRWLQDLHVPDAEPTADVDEGEVLDLARIDELRRVDRDGFLARALAIFLDEGRRHLATVLAAKDARDTTALREAAHALRGSSASMGAARLSRAAAAVEEAASDDEAHRTRLVERLDREWLTATVALSAKIETIHAPK